MTKLKQLILYIANSCDTSRHLLGSTKLNKILWFSDGLYYEKHGGSITGETYIKRQRGPVPHQVVSALNELTRESSLLVKNVPIPFHGSTKKEYIALVEPDISMFTSEEISIVDSMINAVVNNYTAKSISDATHDEIWDLAEIGEEIPFCATLASSLGEINENDIHWAQKSLGLN